MNQWSIHTLRSLRRRVSNSCFVLILAAIVSDCATESPTPVSPGEQVLAKAVADSTPPLHTDTADLVQPLALPDAGPGEVPVRPSSGALRQNSTPVPRPNDPVDTSAKPSSTTARSPLDANKWTELISLDPTFVLDLRYATDNNFVGETMYDCGRCYLRKPAALSLKRLQDSLRTIGLGFKLYDCYRPLSVQWRLWNKVPDRRYVADPRKGSQHNRGVAVDLTLVDLTTGKELDMGTTYDFFGKEAWHASTAGYPEPIRGNRTRLLELMEGMNWQRTSSEWWHYSYRMAKSATPIEEEEWECK